jgi:hypothetical protein
VYSGATSSSPRTHTAARPDTTEYDEGEYAAFPVAGWMTVIVL